jgi:hypothetical protein
MEYLEELAALVSRVHGMQLLGGATQVDESTADQLRGIYDRLHEMAVVDGAEEMHLAFTIYVSVLEEKCLCHIFAEVHSADAQGSQCSRRSASVTSSQKCTPPMPRESTIANVRIVPPIPR